MLNGHRPPEAVITQANPHSELRQLSLLKEVSKEKRQEPVDQMGQFCLRRDDPKAAAEMKISVQ